MTDAEIVKLVMDLSRSWKYRSTHDTSPFEQEMIDMCKEVRRRSMIEALNLKAVHEKI